MIRDIVQTKLYPIESYLSLLKETTKPKKLIRCGKQLALNIVSPDDE